MEELLRSTRAVLSPCMSISAGHPDSCRPALLSASPAAQGQSRDGQGGTDALSWVFISTSDI